MIRIFVDSGSSIKKDEATLLNVTVLPLRILINDTEYLDGVDLDNETFYDYLINKKLFPKTSLPPFEEADKLIHEYTSCGDDVIIITISSGISGTYDVIKARYKDNSKVYVVDSKCAVGGIRILVNEINKHLDSNVDEVLKTVYELIPRIKIIAIPETLTYLNRGGRLSKSECIIGNILKIKPLITFKSGKVHVENKAIGLKSAKLQLVRSLEQYKCDTNYPIVPSYTYEPSNLSEIVEKLDDKYKSKLTNYDNLDHAIACHWGPGAFGLVFVSDK